MADADAIRAAAQQAAAERIEAAALSPLDEATAAKTVWVGHIPDGSASEFELRRRFGVHGSVVSVGLRPKPGTGKTWALVTFDSVDGAQRAVATPTMAQDGAGGAKLQLKVQPADVGRELTSVHSSSDGHALADVAARQQTNVEADGELVSRMAGFRNFAGANVAKHAKQSATSLNPPSLAGTAAAAEASGAEDPAKLKAKYEALLLDKALDAEKALEAAGGKSTSPDGGRGDARVCVGKRPRGVQQEVDG